MVQSWSDMATQNVCRYFKFGYCKYSEKCRIFHVKEECKNKSCEIRTCALRHPKICKFYRDYKRCKFGEWCHLKHFDNHNLETHTEEIMEKLDNLTKLISEKVALIDNLAEKIRILEEKVLGNDENNDDDDTELNNTFVNPSFIINCEMCDFVAKTNGGLHTHKRAKHKEMLDQPESIISETNSETNFQYDLCDFLTENENNLKDHKQLKHATEIEKETVEIKLELFTLVNFKNNVLEVRKEVMENLNEQSEVETVKTVYVNKIDSYMDGGGGQSCLRLLKLCI